MVPSLDWVDFTLPQWQAFTLPTVADVYARRHVGKTAAPPTPTTRSATGWSRMPAALTTSVYDAANQLKTSVSSSGVTTFTYDLAGNQHIQQAPTGVTTSTWNNENRRTARGFAQRVLNTFSYNGDGLRAQLQNSTGGSRMVWDGRAYLAETSTGNVVVTEYTQEPSAYGGLISRTNAGATLYYLLDGLGSTSKLTNASAVITDAYSYTAFGEPVSTIGAGSVNPFRWVGTLGYYFDLDLLEYYLRARTYDPVLARFLTQDPIEFASGGWGLYVYVQNNAINATDPSGEDFIAIGDRSVGFRGLPAYHYSLEYWSTSCPAPKATWKGIRPSDVPTLNGDPDAMKVAGVELQQSSNLWLAHYTKPGLSYQFRRLVSISFIQQRSDATRIVPLKDRVAVADWLNVLDWANAYGFAEHPPGLGTQGPKPPLHNWPESVYYLLGTNSNVFIRWLVGVSGMTMIEMRGWHPPNPNWLPQQNEPPGGTWVKNPVPLPY